MPCGADDGGGGPTEGAAGAGFVSGAAAEGLVDGAGGFLLGVSAIASDPENEPSNTIKKRMLKKVANDTRPPRVGQDPLLAEARPQAKRTPEWRLRSGSVNMAFFASFLQRYFSRSRYRVVKKSSDTD